ncbi:MAG: hypothetical protein WBN75_19490 [Verrucomicrobiia bacterium]|jgi:hypothetical protein
MDTDGESRNPIVLVVVLILVIEAGEIEDEDENKDENLRRQPAEAKRGTFPGSAGVSPASSSFRLPTGRRDAGAPKRFMAN